MPGRAEYDDVYGGELLGKRKKKKRPADSPKETIIPKRPMAWATYLRLKEQTARAATERDQAGKDLGTAEGDWHESGSFEDANYRFCFYNIVGGLHRSRAYLAEIVEPRQETDSVQMGNTVLVHWNDSPEPNQDEGHEKYTILGPDDTGTNPNWVSAFSPFGQSIIGKKPGESFSYFVEQRRLGGKIISVLPGEFEGKPDDSR